MHQIRSWLRDVSRTPRILLPLVVLIFICLFGTWTILETPSEGLERQIVSQHGGIYGIPKGPAPSINLVIAATSKDDYSWNIVSALNSLDLREVQRRKFLNLRVTWGNGCSTVLNTTAGEKSPAGIPEQRSMQDAFRANFDIYDIPESLASPCCSQIVVVREVIQGVPRTQYTRHIEWILKTNLKDDISGRVWEHMWHYLFLHKTIDCPIEHLAYCRLYHICFGGKEAYEEWVGLNKGRESLERELKKLDKADKMGGKGEDGKNSTNGSDKSLDSDSIKRAKEGTRKSLVEQLGSLKEIIRIKRSWLLPGV
ncbi:hypothetical protein DSL72_004570 [Monilinia vaccinii-corymbosi]|uniref:Uncharacterized protein n=1 Tax=Monilinia vaccinii-corymbosi TaxID=61207 RepID=A0A8A3NZK8_9HELO|nr:hypothetical protein DSL72_004570 [Monilinia vaccinii-corymbosi]